MRRKSVAFTITMALAFCCMACSSATQEMDTQVQEKLSVAYQFGNMQKNAPPGNYMDYGDKILFENYSDELGRFMWYTLDKATGEVRCFCSDASCDHTLPTCDGVAGMGNLEQYDGKMYALDSAWQITELKDGEFKKIVDGAVYNFWHANDNLYAVTRDGSLVVFENGSKTPTILIDEYTDRWNVVFGNYLYGCNSEGGSRVDLSAKNPQKEMIVDSEFSMVDGEHIYYCDNKTFLLYRCDMDGSNVQQLTEQPVHPASRNFDDEYFYFAMVSKLTSDTIEAHDIYRMSKENPEEMVKIATIEKNSVGGSYVVPGYNNLIFSTQYTIGEGFDTQYINEMYLVAKDGSKVEKLEIPEF